MLSRSGTPSMSDSRGGNGTPGKEGVLYLECVNCQRQVCLYVVCIMDSLTYRIRSPQVGMRRISAHVWALARRGGQRSVGPRKRSKWHMYFTRRAPLMHVQAIGRAGTLALTRVRRCCIVRGQPAAKEQSKVEEQEERQERISFMAACY